MTRIIAGSFRGRELKVPNSVTRPTSSRVREAIFSSTDHLQDGFSDLKVLDLYAGSGAYAIEAISRGAVSAVSIEKAPLASEVIKQNAKSLNLENLKVITMDVSVVLKNENQFGLFDLVFLDPPYALNDKEIEADLENLCHGWLAPFALVVVERDKHSKFQIPDCYEDLGRKVYGDTTVWYGRYETNS